MSKPQPSATSPAPLADSSILLLLVLVHHDPGTGYGTAPGGTASHAANPFRLALNTCVDTYCKSA
eukprot:5486246-Pyramimonas_sp.AAC.1